MRKIVVTKNFAIIALIMVVLSSLSVSAMVETPASMTTTIIITETAETDEEQPLQKWFDTNGYAINVTEDELGIETFEAGHYQTTILAEIAEYASSNNLSWYPTSSGELHLIFSEANSTGDAMVFEATETFGLCLGTPDGLFYNEPNSHLFYTETDRNPDEFDHALVFAHHYLPNGYIIVLEDLWEGGDMDFQDMVLLLAPVIEAKICICPHTLNLKSRGRWITGFIKLPKDYDVEDIDVSTITLNGTIPAEPKPTAIFDFDCIDVKVLMVKFNRTAAIEYIKSTLAIDGDSAKCIKITLTVSGKLYNGQVFEGSTKIRIIHFQTCTRSKADD